MLDEVTGTVFRVQRFSVHDGDGIRTTAFFKGCPMKCLWCHNPEGICGAPQLAYLEERCVLCGRCAGVCAHGAHDFSQGRHGLKRSLCTLCGACAEVCPVEALRLVGRKMTAGEVVGQAAKDRPFYAGGGGLTCSGGECTMQPEFLYAVLAVAKEAGLNTAVDTCGAAPYMIFERILPFADAFLYDVKMITPQLHRAYTGTDNGLILRNYQRLQAAGAKIDVRIPLIPSVNDTWLEVERIGEFLCDVGKPRTVKVVPYHSPGSGKYAQLGKTAWRAPREYAMTPQQAQQRLESMLERK